MKVQARRFTVKDAATQAQTLAEASSVRLGKPITLSETTAGSLPPMIFAKTDEFVDESVQGSTPIAAGALTIVVNISVFSEIQ